MENASKALLIAGGVLIAIILIGLLLTGFTIIRSNENANVKAQATKELKEFNQKFEAYNKKALYGTDVITVMKMATQYNDVTVEAYQNDKTTQIIESNIINNYKGKIFYCFNVEYSSETGKITKLKFCKKYND